MSDLRHCNKCGNDWPPTLDYFFADKRTGHGFRSPCKQCIKDYRTANKESLQSSRKKHYAANSGKIKQYVREHTQANKERVSTQRKQFREANKERLKQTRQQFKQEHPEVLRKWRHDWAVNHRDRRRENEHRREARKKNILGTHTANQIREQYERQKGKCYYCSKKLKWGEHEIEHTYPISRVAGTDIPANSIDYLVIACRTCNTKKNNRYPWEFPEGGRLL